MKIEQQFDVINAVLITIITILLFCMILIGALCTGMTVGELTESSNTQAEQHQTK